MTSNRPAALMIMGTRYRCRLRYLHVESLDALSEFIYGVLVKSRQYRRIDVLIRSFGLPPRLMEDVLADLIRTRRAWLDVELGQIVPVAQGQPAQYEDRWTLDVWQDHVTGAILPASLVGPYSPKISDAVGLARSDDQGNFISFLDADDSSLLSALTRIDPTIEFSFDRVWQLDRFVDRARVDSQAIHIPLVWTTIREEIDTPFIEAPEIPWWLARAWMGQWQRQERHSVNIVPFAGYEGAEGAIATALQYARLRYHAARWLESAQEHLDLIPAPEAVQDIRSLDQRFGALQARLLSLVSFQLHSETSLAQLIGSRSRSVLLASESADGVGWAVIPDTAPGAEITRISSTGTTLVGGPEHHTIPIAGWKDDFALVEGVRLLLPLVGTGTECSFLEVSGADVGRSIEGLLRRLLGDRSDLLPDVPRPTTRRDELREVRFASNGLSVAEILGELAEFRREFLNAMQERRVRKPLADWRGADTTIDGFAQAADEAPNERSLGRSHVSLVDRLNALRVPFSHPLQPNHSAFAFVEGQELLDLIEMIVVEPPGASNLCQIVSRLSDVSPEAEVVGAIRRGVERGWRFHICPPGTPEQSALADRLRAELRSVHVRFFAAPPTWRACVAILNDLVVAGTYHILADRSGERLAQGWIVILGSSAGETSLLDNVEKWPEIAKL